jgi:hypothetical protein
LEVGFGEDDRSPVGGRLPAGAENLKKLRHIARRRDRAGGIPAAGTGATLGGGAVCVTPDGRQGEAHNAAE